MPKAKLHPALSLLTVQDYTLMLINFQPQMAFGTKSIDPVILRNDAY